MWDEQRGVTDRRVAPVLCQLIAAALIKPHGAFEEAVWVIAEPGRNAADELWGEVATDEAEAVRSAAQRAMAIVVAWSKTARP